MLKNNKNNKRNDNSNEYLRNLLGLNILTLTNKTYGVGKYDLMHLMTPSRVDLDYLALYSDYYEYTKTTNTGVCFYEYDKYFDGINGIWNSIYYNNKKQLLSLKKCFSKIRYIISPDYSLCGDIPEIFNIYNIQRSRIVALWLVLECGKLVIPGITYADERSFEYMLDGLEECNVVAFSSKGSLQKKSQSELLIKAVNFTVDSLKFLKQIIVYDASTDFERTRKLYFKSALEKGIDILFPENRFHERRLQMRGGKYGQI